MKKLAFKKLALFLIVSVCLSTVAQAEDKCDIFCEVKKVFTEVNNISGDVLDIDFDIQKLIKPDPLVGVLLSSDGIEKAWSNLGLQDPPNCSEILGYEEEDIDATTTGFTNLRLYAGLPIDYIKDVVPDDTISTKVRVGALIAYYTYKYCEFTLERDTINKDTEIRDNAHQKIIDKQNNIITSLEAIDLKLVELKTQLTDFEVHTDERFDVLEKLITTPSGQRANWNKK